MKYLFSLIVLLAGLPAFCQKIDIKWSEESKNELNFTAFVLAPGNKTIKLCESIHKGLLKKTSTPVLSLFDEKLNLVTEYEYPLNDENQKVEDLVNIKGKIFLFTSLYDKGEKTTNYYCQELDTKKLATKGKNISMGTFDAVNRKNQSNISLEYSADTSKVLAFSLAPYVKKENQKYFINVFDSAMRKIWSKEITLPYTDKYVDVSDYLVTNDGTVGVVIKNYDKEVVKDKVKVDGENVPGYKTKLLLYNKNGTEPKEILIDMGNLFVNSLQITNDINGSLYLFGLYRNTYNGFITGYFTVIVDKNTGEVKKDITEAFSNDLVKLISTDNQGSDREKDPGISGNFRLKDKIKRMDGSVDFILEYYRVEERKSQSGGVGGLVGGVVSVGYTPVIYTYYYGDIIDIYIKNNGSSVVTRIPKLQISTSTIYSHYLAMPLQNKLVILYNDDKDNLTRDLNRRPDPVTNFNKCAMALTVIDADGKFTREMVADNKEMELTTCPGVSGVLDNNRIAIYAMKGKGLFSASKDMVGIITFF